MKRKFQPTDAPAQERGRVLKEFWRSEDGATSIEYGLIVALIFLAIIASVRAFSENTSGMYTTISDTLDNG